ncbi:Lysine methyltransferase [Phytophthora infestans]|uniref:Lysine methyltransferase n=1 Tax=Phytophthora infestans TaxID=4787 RepID=A0A833S9Q5_PHYIN|nr:Lysine methyltransferase [Phytophthora infestans]KAF4150139.1 Lysine methyltransferase [Phytophthora infestans]KAI9982970.1 hypothetical protein PInf_006821 [Phytophthora infestans]
MAEEALTTSEPLALESSFTHWARLVEVPIGEDRVVSVEQDPDSFVLGTTVWDSSKTLLKFIEQRPERFQRFSSICELGAGCGGLAGIASAIVTGGLADVVLTDIGPVLPWLRRNVRENLTDKELQRVRVEQHAWGTPVTNLKAPFDCILCADVVYEKACVKPLVQSLLALSHRKTVIFLANERRALEVRAEFMKHLDSYFQWKEVPKTELDADYLKEAIEVFEMRPKKRKVPLEMQIETPDNYNPDEQEYHPLGSGAGNEADPYDRDLWSDLLRDLSIDPADMKKPS